MPDLPLLTWALVVTALVVGILAGHFGWGRRWPTTTRKLHPDYLTGLDFLVTEQPDRALDMFLKLMDANADTIETHFALGSLYRRRGEVERAIRIHQNLLARDELPAEHREQALLALARDYLRAGVLDRAEALFLEVSKVPRLRVSALDALRGVYERQHDWQQALGVWRQLDRMHAAPPQMIAAHYTCELALSAIERGELDAARGLLREARAEVISFPRAAILRAQIAELQAQPQLAVRLIKRALQDAPTLLQEELPHLLRLAGPESRDAILEELVEQAQRGDFSESKRLVFAAIAADLADAKHLRGSINRVFAEDPTLRAVSQSAPDSTRIAHEIGALLAQAEKFRCIECGFSARNFYWHCPACHAWESFEPYAIVKLR